MATPSKILIVEDEYIVALDIKSHIQRMGHPVVGIAGTGHKAIELAVDMQPDLILMDIQLRGPLDGIDTATLIRDKLGIPIVYLTAFTDANTLERASTTQPLGYIIKPYQGRELDATIKMALYKSQIEAELKTYVNQLDLIMVHATDGFILIDSDMNVLRMNQIAETYLSTLGYIPDTPLTSIKSQSLASLLSSDVSQQRLTFEVSDPDHRVFELSVSKPFVSDSDRIPEQSNLARLLVIRDITMQHHMQRQREENARMSSSGQLAASISHDFNNILGTIITQTYLLKTTQPLLLEQSLNLIDNIRNHVIQAAELISQLQDLSHDSQPERSLFNLNSLMSKLMTLVRRTFPESISIQYINEPSECWIAGDPIRISQALMNLMLRAKEEMPKGGKLDVKLEISDSSDIPKYGDLDIFSDQWIKIIVKDTGKPIDDEVLTRIFVPNIEPENVQQGHLLLLAEVNNIVTQHNGHIIVNSNSDETTFEIYLPSD